MCKLITQSFAHQKINFGKTLVYAWLLRDAGNCPIPAHIRFFFRVIMNQFHPILHRHVFTVILWQFRPGIYVFLLPVGTPGVKGPSTRRKVRIVNHQCLLKVSHHALQLTKLAMSSGQHYTVITLPLICWDTMKVFPCKSAPFTGKGKRDHCNAPHIMWSTRSEVASSLVKSESLQKHPNEKCVMHWYHRQKLATPWCQGAQVLFV